MDERQRFRRDLLWRAMVQGLLLDVAVVLLSALSISLTDTISCPRLVLRIAQALWGTAILLTVLSWRKSSNIHLEAVKKMDAGERVVFKRGWWSSNLMLDLFEAGWAMVLAGWIYMEVV